MINKLEATCTTLLRLLVRLLGKRLLAGIIVGLMALGILYVAFTPGAVFAALLLFGLLWIGIAVMVAFSRVLKSLPDAQAEEGEGNVV